MSKSRVGTKPITLVNLEIGESEGRRDGTEQEIPESRSSGGGRDFVNGSDEGSMRLSSERGSGPLPSETKRKNDQESRDDRGSLGDLGDHFFRSLHGHLSDHRNPGSQGDLFLNSLTPPR